MSKIIYNMDTAKQILKTLELEPLPQEGGFFKETFQSSIYYHPKNWEGERMIYSCIYYMITPQSYSVMHQLPGDEIFHFYKGDPAEICLIYPNGEQEIQILGNNILQGERPQILVPGGTWQACKLVKGGTYCLMGTTMSPGFDYKDYKHGNRNELISQYPHLKSIICLNTIEN